MSTTVDVKFFNSFLIKKTIKEDTASTPDGQAVWAGLPSNPRYYPKFPVEASTASTVVDFNWFVEESRIRGGFNEAEVDLAARAYFKTNEKGFNRSSNSLIYSGIFNSRTSINQSNVFSVGEDITRSVEPRYGSIQRLYADDSNLTIMQEYRLSRALIDRDAIYSAEGNPITTRADKVIGEVQYYSGDYGIGKNPESFATDGNRRYLADQPNGAVLRLSNDGINEISEYGMSDFFRDEFKQISNQRVRRAYDFRYTLVSSTDITTIDFEGDNLENIEIGMAIEGIVGHSDLYVADIGGIVDDEVTVTLSKTINVTISPQPTVLTLFKYVKDEIVGGFDNNYENYVLSIVKNSESRVSASEDSGLFIPDDTTIEF